MEIEYGTCSCCLPQALSEDLKARLEQLQIDFEIQESWLDKLKPKVNEIKNTTWRYLKIHILYPQYEM